MLVLKQSSSQAVKHKLGFTLSELLVSLAVLGLIAGLTVPSIVTSVQKSKQKALQKETIGILKTIVQDGYLNGEFSGISDWDFDSTSAPIVQFFSKRLNGTNCPRGKTTFPCDFNIENEGVTTFRNNHSARWVLLNGVKILLDPYVRDNANGGRFGTQTWIGLDIDSKPEGINQVRGVVNSDQLILVCNVSETTLVTSIYEYELPAPMAPGMCGPVGYNNSIAQFNALYS
jgi:prepilin-type N-terminal cleavage/methylation domain-containing protein